MPNDFIDRLRRQRDEQGRGDLSSEHVIALHEQKVTFYAPIADLIGQMYDAGVTFPAGRPPTRSIAMAAAERSTVGPRVRISIDTRREIILELTSRDQQLMFSAYIWEISRSTSALVTVSIGEVADWLAEQVAQFGYQPSRQTQWRPRRRAGMPPATPGPPVPPEETVVIEDDDEGSDGREQRVIDLNE